MHLNSLLLGNIDIFYRDKHRLLNGWLKDSQTNIILAIMYPSKPTPLLFNRISGQHGSASFLESREPVVQVEQMKMDGPEWVDPVPPPPVPFISFPPPWLETSDPDLLHPAFLEIRKREKNQNCNPYF